MSKIVENGPADKEEGLQIHDRIIEVCVALYSFSYGGGGNKKNRSRCTVDGEVGLRGSCCLPRKDDDRAGA